MTSIADIRALVADHFGLSVNDLTSRETARRYSQPRQFVMALARKHTRTSSAMVARKLGGRDGSTIRHGARRIMQLRASDPNVAEAWNALEAKL